jgi:TRAP-type C4-dicarboxylate transport system permease small subunit
MRAQFERIVAWWAIAAGLLLFAIIAVTTTNVAAFALDRMARWSGGTVSGLPGYEDFVQLVVSCAALMFMPYCQLRRGHVAVDLFVKGLPLRARLVIEALSLAGMALLAAFLAYWMAVGMVETQGDRAVSRVLGWPVWPFYLPGIASLVLWAATAALMCADAVTGRMRHV